MKSSAPWSVKGIERDARETAKEAARREGMTVGEWLCQVIYAASDPESSNGEIEGIKTSDIVTAIEHLNKRAIAAETKSAAAMEDLTRNLGTVLERLQRIERAEGSPGVEERLKRLEARAGDRQRIEALKALELAVGQVALQFDAAQKSTAGRLESTERQLQELASRIDTVGSGGGAAAASADSESAAVSSLKETLDGLSERIERAERIASEAAEIRAEAGESVDSEFVERTGARLRILGDEIKRSGDQIRSLEGLIKKLSDQIDAAERRSSEGVQKVSETITELKSQFGQPEAPEASGARKDIEAVMTEVTERTESRIAELQRNFEQMLARIGETAPAAEALAAEAPELVKPEAAQQLAAAEPEAEAEEDVRTPSVEEAFAAFEEDEEGEAMFGRARDEDEIAESDEDEDEEDGFSFSEQKLAAEKPETDPLKLLRDVEETESPETSPSRTEDATDGLEALLADLDDLNGAAPAPRETNETAPSWLRTPEASEAPSEDLSGETAGDTTGEIGGEPRTRRNLTPKQRAILAAKIRRKRLAEQGLTVSESVDAPKAERSQPLATPVEPREEAEEERESVSLFAKAAGAFSTLRARLPGAAPASDEEDNDEAETATGEAPSLVRSARQTLTRAGGVKPVTLALGGAVVLASAALFFVVKDLGSGDAVKAIPAPAPADNNIQSAPEQTPEPQASVPEAPEAPVTQPRTLYLDAVAKLSNAKSDGETRAALQELQQAAALGHPPAQLQLGELYKLGQVVPQDPAQARIWYQRAGDGGNLLAMHRAGVMAALGQGGPKDQAAAISWFEKSANLGLVDSQYNLGAIFYPTTDGGASSVQDAGKAYFWYSLAAQNGDAQAGDLATRLASNFSPEERRALDAKVAAWKAQTPDPAANEVASAQ